MKTKVTPSPEGVKAERALKRAVARVYRENQKLGIPVAVMKNNRAVLLPVSEALKIKRA